MIVSIIVAMDEQGGIGIDNRIPWRLRSDMRNFKAVTMGHHLIQGRKTWESIGRPLPGRTMVVVTRNTEYSVPEGVQVTHSLAEALELARLTGEQEAFVGGGAGIYKEALPIADRLYLTRVHASVETDTRFPDFDESEWTVLDEMIRVADEHNQFTFTYQLLTRNR